MQFGLFGSAAARRPTSADNDDFDCSEGYRDFIEYNVEAEALALRRVPRRHPQGVDL
jgi:hypothetical protein